MAQSAEKRLLKAFTSFVDEKGSQKAFEELSMFQLVLAAQTEGGQAIFVSKGIGTVEVSTIVLGSEEEAANVPSSAK